MAPTVPSASALATAPAVRRHLVRSPGVAGTEPFMRLTGAPPRSRDDFVVAGPRCLTEGVHMTSGAEHQLVSLRRHVGRTNGKGPSIDGPSENYEGDAVMRIGGRTQCLSDQPPPRACRCEAPQEEPRKIRRRQEEVEDFAWS